MLKTISYTSRNSYETGFTLIELILTIVILGILAAVAIPQFTDLTGNAQLSATQGIAGGIQSASGNNYAVCSINSASNECITVNSCDDGASLLASGIDTSIYTLNTTAIEAGETLNTCTISDGTNAITFSLTGTLNTSGG
ncbi:MAG: prepilin-type N-terminal cleavage/methylation domain-containing protein [Magnetococcales bacterium]|nr:prepilin-type N-terminal cleavage/methylation domain-containing protein [Magnetococcales bacterium]